MSANWEQDEKLGKIHHRLNNLVDQEVVDAEMLWGVPITTLSLEDLQKAYVYVNSYSLQPNLKELSQSARNGDCCSDSKVLFRWSVRR